MKSTIARMNTGRVLSRWSSQPVIGMTTAIVRANAVVSHWPSAGVTSRSSMISGIATLIVVSFKKTTKAAARSSTSASRVCADSGSTPDCGAAAAGELWVT